MADDKAKKRILILSRKYPPSVGGMQAYTKNFIRRMEDIYRVDRIVLGRGQVNLIWFLPYLFVRSALLVMTRRYDLVYLCDALLAPFGIVLKGMFKVKVAVTVHGLDITCDRFFYQRVVPKAVAKLDKVICVSRNTMVECLKRGVREDICEVITNAVEPGEYRVDLPGRDGIKGPGRSIIDLPMEKKILLTVGRLIRRKGVDWFIEKVMPRLPDDYIYLVAGEGPEKKNILKVIDDHNMKDRVRLLGKISDDDLKILYNSAHAMVMCNQKIDRDPEGFGIVAIEAASCGLPVIANSVDGIREAVLDGRTGWLVEYNNIDFFVEKIKDPGLGRETVEKENKVFTWDRIIEKYRVEIESV